MATTSP